MRLKKITALKIAAGISVAGAIAICTVAVAMPVDVTKHYTPAAETSEGLYTSVSKADSSVHETTQSSAHKSNNGLALSDDDKYLLAKLVMAEAEDEPLYSQACVALVVLNRVEDPEFPDNIYDVIFQPGQFTSVSNGRWDRVEPNDAAKSTIYFIGTGWDESKGATYFATEGCSQWHSQNLKYLFTKGSHAFFKEMS